MIKLTATAPIYSISPVIEIPSRNGGQNFYKRELVLDDTHIKDGNTYSNFVSIEFTGDKMPMLDAYAPGQRVTVEAFIKGNERQGRIFHSIRGLSIAPYQSQQDAYPQQTQYAPPANYPTYPQQGGYAAPAAYPPPAYPQQGGYAPAPAPGRCASPGTQGNSF